MVMERNVRIVQYCNIEKNDNDNSLQVKEKNGSPCQGNFGAKKFCDERNDILPPLQLQEYDGNTKIKAVHEDPQKSNSSTFKDKKEHVKCHDEYQEKSLEVREMSYTQNEVLEPWLKVTYIKKWAPIFVQNATSASTLENKHLQIRAKNNKKLVMRKRYDVSKQALNLERFFYNSGMADYSNSRSWDCLGGIYRDDLIHRENDMFLNQRSCMVATLQIIQENFSELNSTWELKKVEELKLEELRLEENPSCGTFSDESDHVPRLSQTAFRAVPPHVEGGLRCWAISSYFLFWAFVGKAALLGKEPEDSLDDWSRSGILLGYREGQELFPAIASDNEVPALIKPCEESYKGSETLKNLVVQFLFQYYLIYDYGNRYDLLSAYHDEACFSLTISFNHSDPHQTSLKDYFKYNRNIKWFKNSFLKMQLLKHTKFEIVSCLDELPKTQHDFNSYVVDMCTYMENMISFSVNGMFKEVEGKFEGCVRAFTRTFILTSDSYSNLCIVNDEMTVSNVSPNKMRSSFSSTLFTTSSNSVVTLTENQQEVGPDSSVQYE
uniref:nuclear RNA export factor 2-like n=1 Tax=Jaculus jaculus TaxID=51337 RepID=UPI001E1B4928|nr:nuclear RNA export factor 2-like [Jaculus jaculus]